MTFPSRRLRAFLLGALVAGCTPVSSSYVVHSAELGCEEGNRYAYAAVTDMNMRVTSFTPARRGQPGFLKAVGKDRRGEVRITCDDAGVHIDPTQTSMGDRVFERGVFLSVTGRSGLHMDRGEITGRERPAGDLAQTVADGVPVPSGSVLVEVQPQRGFETVLDFDADVASAGILPIKVTIRNGSKRAYSFSLDGVIVRKRDSSETAPRMTAAEAASMLATKAGSGGSQTGVGNVESARKIIIERELKAAKLPPGASVTGYVYYPVADYDRAKIQMMDVAAQEIESFLVEF
ncbi:MAG: hypothetical protein ABR587_01975 [Candidatus Binatia bacterium]